MRHPHVTDAGGPAGRGGPPPPLLAIAHGSRDPRAAAAIDELLGRVRRRAAWHGFAGLRVRTAYLDHAPPSPAQVLSALHGSAVAASRGGAAAAGLTAGAGPVIALPLLLTDAYHSKTDIPSVLRAAAAPLPGLRIRYGRPLGPHPLLSSALEWRLARAGVRIGDAGTAVVLAAAGSADPAATAAVSRLASAWQTCRGWRAVVPAFASAAPPSPADAVTALRRDGARRVVVASYLLAPGLVADKVRDTSLAAGAAAVSGTLAVAPEMADLVLLRYATASAAPSRLASPMRGARRLA